MTKGSCKAGTTGLNFAQVNWVEIAEEKEEELGEVELSGHRNIRRTIAAVD